jgi:hypothetical protein
MRTTLTIDPDVAVGLERLRRAEKLSLKQAVNEVLRRGLQSSEKPAVPKPYRTRVVDHGPLLVPSLDNIEDVLAQIEDQKLW